MNARKEIKVPAAQIWREFRMRFLPLAVFAVALVAAVVLWNQTVVGPTMVGEVEMVQAIVTAPEAGVLTNLQVRPFQLVKEGDVLGELIITDLRATSGASQDLRSRIAISQLEVNSVIDQQRMAFDYQSMTMSTLSFRADLAEAKAQLPTAEATLKRYEQGLKEQVIPYNDYEQAKLFRDALVAKIAELEKLVTDAELRVQQAARAAGPFTNMASTEVSDLFKRLNRERQESVQRQSIILKATRDGTVGTIYRRSGENVVAGETILTIHALEADRIIAYMRPGSTITPTKGMSVRVRCRSKQREEAVSKIEEIGFRYEAITNQALLRPGMQFELGMPVGISMPQAFRSLLRPGELVDLALEP